MSSSSICASSSSAAALHRLNITYAHFPIGPARMNRQTESLERDQCEDRHHRLRTIARTQCNDSLRIKATHRAPHKCGKRTCTASAFDSPRLVGMNQRNVVAALAPQQRRLAPTAHPAAQKPSPMPPLGVIQVLCLRCQECQPAATQPVLHAHPDHRANGETRSDSANSTPQPA